MIRKIAFCLLFTCSTFASTLDFLETNAVFRGAWSSNEAYAINDVTHFEDNIFVKHNDDHVQGVSPSTSSNWYIIVSVSHCDQALVYFPSDQQDEWKITRIGKNHSPHDLVQMLLLVIIVGFIICVIWLYRDFNKTGE